MTKNYVCLNVYLKIQSIELIEKFLFNVFMEKVYTNTRVCFEQIKVIANWTLLTPVYILYVKLENTNDVNRHI